MTNIVDYHREIALSFIKHMSVEYELGMSPVSMTYDCFCAVL